MNDQYFTYQYDAEGRVTFSNSAGQWQYPMYNALGQRVMDDQGGANPELKLTYPRDIFVQRTGTWAEYANWTGWNVYWSQVAGQRLNMGGSSAFIDHADAVGSTTMETDPSGAVVWDVTHYPSGQVFQEQGTRQSEVAMGLDWQVNDPAIPSATREYNFRVYRWQTPDPMGGDVTNPQSLNRYAYVLNNPTTLTDPLGLNPADRCSDPAYYFSHAQCGGPPPGDCEEYDLGDCGGNPFPPFGGYGGSSGYGGGGSVSSAPPAGQPPLVGGPGYWPFGCPFPYNSMGLCGVPPNLWTGQIGASVNFTLPWWGLTGTYYFGLAFDLRGNIAAYYGGGFGHGVGASGSAGVQVGDSNAYTVCGLRGPFAQVGGTAGADAGER